jgi:hypothetical protein
MKVSEICRARQVGRVALETHTLQYFAVPPERLIRLVNSLKRFSER